MYDNFLLSELASKCKLFVDLLLEYKSVMEIAESGIIPIRWRVLLIADTNRNYIEYLGRRKTNIYDTIFSSFDTSYYNFVSAGMQHHTT